MKKRLVWLGVICLLATTAAARDLEDILKDKKVIDATEANEAKAAKEKQQAATEKALASIPTLPEWVKMVTLFGDVRIRNETFFQDGTKDRIRQRFRLRFGAKINPNDEMEFGFKLASGNANDPISNNQTFTDEFTFKNINIANAYVKLSPSHSDRPGPAVGHRDGRQVRPALLRPAHPEPAGLRSGSDPGGLLRDHQGGGSEGRWSRTLALNMGQFIFQENSQHRRGSDLRLPGADVAGLRQGDVQPGPGRLPLRRPELDRGGAQHQQQPADHQLRAAVGR